MEIFDLYAVDTEAANNGRWFTTRQGARVKVAKLGNPNFTAEVVRLQRPHIHLIRSKADTTELITDITIEAMSKTILVDWEATSNGEPLPYTPKLGQELMRKSPDFQEDVSLLSSNVDNFKPEEIAEK